MQLILLRHGESEWNLLNQFTGWTDVDLTENGIQEAKFSAEQILKENLGNHLIVAHSNSLRAIVKILDKLSDEEIVSVNIPTGVPLVYQLDDNLNVTHKEYLIDQIKLKEKQEIVKNQGKIK